MREVADVPVEVLAALTTDFCIRVPLGDDDGEVAIIGNWLVVRTFAPGAEGYPPLVESMRAFRVDGDASDALDALLEEVPGP